MNAKNELLYFNALKECAAYESSERLQSIAEKKYGLSYVEALEMAYDNIRETAAFAIRGKHRPKVQP